MLPWDLHCEQLEIARQILANSGLIPVVAERRVIKANNSRRVGRLRSRSVARQRPPEPKADFPEAPILKQQVRGRDGEKEELYLMEAEDVQAVIERWVGGFRDTPPNAKDIDFFAQFLVKRVGSGLGKGTDVGVEKAVKVVKWWLVLLRRYWEPWEHEHDRGVHESPEVGRNATEVIAHAWWKAFREIKGRMDVVARKKFGGSLSLR